MNAQTMLANTRQGIARAERSPDGTWSVTTVLDTPEICTLARMPGSATTVYAGTRGAGLLRSEDGGRTWQAAGLPGQTVKAIGLTPANPQQIIVGTKPPALFLSRDGGETWQELAAFRKLRRWFWFTPAEPGDPYVMGLAVSPTNPDVIVAGVEFGGVFVSHDGGQTWRGHLRGTSRDCHALTFHARDGRWAYQAGGGWPAAVSKDCGNTWQQPRRGMGWSLYAMACAADPYQPDVWYVSAAPYVVLPEVQKMPRAHWDGAATASIFRMEGNGHWKRLHGGLPQPLDHMPYALVTDPAAPGHLYAGLSNGVIWHTADYGDSWQQLPVKLPGVHYSLVIL
ncbi:MAG: glycosyl hydrolase [Anaerolineae bacterium]